MGEVLKTGAIPPPPPGFVPVGNTQATGAIPPPPPGFVPADQAQATPAAAPQKPWYQMTMSELADAGIGAMKGVGQTAHTAVHAASMGLEPLLNVAEARYAPNLQQTLTPQGTAQKVGAGAEQAGEMMLTGGVLRKGAEALAAKALPTMTGKALPATARIAAESVNAGANAAVHGENPIPAAATGAVGGAIGEALPLAVNPLKQAAKTQYNKFLNPTAKATKAMADKITPELLDRGVVAASGDALEKKAGAQVGELGQQINDAVSKVPASVKPNTQNVIDDLEKYKQGFMVNGTPIDSTAVKNVEQLQDTIKALGPDVSYQSLNKVRQILDAKPAKAGAFAGKVLADGTDLDVQKEGANAIRRELSVQSPDIAKINAEFHFWRQVEDVVGATNDRKIGQSGGIIKPILTAGGIAGGFSHGGATAQGAGEAALAGLAIHYVAQATQSPLWRTVSAVTKNKIADAMAAGNFRVVVDMLGRGAAAGAGVASIPQQQ